MAQPGRTGQPTESIQTCSDRKSTRLNSSHLVISYAVFCLKKKNTIETSIALFESIPTMRIDSQSSDSLPKPHVTTFHPLQFSRAVRFVSLNASSIAPCHR